MAKRNHTDVTDDGPDRKRKTVLTNVNVNIVEKNERHKSKRKLEDIEKIERALLDVSEKPQQLTGSVERIFVRNFMCHSALEINFNKNINFVIGRNGSGKSAILTSLVVGLGGRAADTNRGKSVKGFIKTGETTCLIEIVLKNSGVCAYNPDQYGDKITIIRQITGSTSSYRLKSTSGQIISTSGKEVNRICDALNIQVNNPVCILNQDTSRNFLNSSDPKRKYTLFMRATNLESINDFYKAISLERSAIAAKLDVKREAFTELKQQMKSWQLKIKMIESLDEYQEDLRNIQTELFWRQHKDYELQHQQVKSTLDKITQQYNKLKEKTNSKQYDEDGIKEKIKDLKQQINEIKNESQTMERTYQNMRVQIQGFKEQLDRKEGEVRSKAASIRHLVVVHDEQDLQLKKIIAEADEIATKRVQQQNQLEAVSTQIAQLDTTLRTSEEELQQRIKSVKFEAQEESKLRGNNNEIENNIGQLRSQIQSLSKDTNTLSLYGPYMAQCLQEIENNKNKFTEPPRGPIGMYIKVRDKKWTAAVELYIKHSMLKTFCVTNGHDSKVLSEIFKRVFRNAPKPSIISSKFFHRVHDVGRKRVQCPEGLMSLQDVLDISDPVVENCLIDQIKMESILLIPSEDDAIRLMSKQENVPPNCSKGVTISGDIYFPVPDYKSFATRFQRATLLQSSTKDIITQFQTQIRELEIKKQDNLKQIETHRRTYNEQKQKLQTYEKKVSELRKMKAALQYQKRSIEFDSQAVDSNTDTMLAEFEDTKRQIAAAKRIEEQLKNDCLEIKSKIETHSEELKGYKTTLETLNKRLEPLQIQKSEAENSMQEYISKSDIEMKKLQEIKSNFQKYQELEQRSLTVLKEHLENRPDFEIENPRTEQELQVAEKALRKSIQKIESQNDDPAHVREMFNTCKEKYDSSKEIIELLGRNFDLITKSIDERMIRYPQIVKRVGKTVERMFHNVLKLRQYQGHIEINHDKKELELHVQTQNNTTNKCDTRTLSGGERSYATVAFIMALWKCVKFPFYFMDEFDVFMDKVNRKTIMDLLLQHADEHSECQFVFLTPQDISDIESRPELTIHRMSDPERDEAA